MTLVFVILALLVGLAAAFPVGLSRGRAGRAVLDDGLKREAQAEAERIRSGAEVQAQGVRAETAAMRQDAERVREEASRLYQEAEVRQTQVAQQREQALADVARETARERADTERGRIEAERDRTDAERDRTDALRERTETLREREALKQDRQDTKRERDELKREIERLNRRAEQLDARGDKLDGIEERLEAGEKRLAEDGVQLQERLRAAELKLYEVAALTPEQAREQILSKLDAELEDEKAIRVRAMQERASADAKRHARHVIAQAIQRSASETSAALSVSVVPIPSDAMKGRIIGREGRNIRAFESLTGVDLIIDDTPEAVILSSFNPVRREVAKHVLEALVQDGRIHPSRIEEMVHKAQDDMKTFIHTQGEEAASSSGVLGIKPGLVQLLGRMYFRSSYGQNVLKHSVQVAHLTGIMAAELGLDVNMARRAGLMHDVGKSIDREIEGTHVDIGVSLAKRFGEPMEVIDAIAHHHDPENGETLYSVLVAAADAISAARPGARREELESYIKRLENLEHIAVSFPGVQTAYAVQAGREVRVLVQPDKVSDAQATLLAREIASRVEQDMEYPGQVQVTVVRESRAVEIAK
ncbi:ribonuclease Y [Deinococcus sp. UYEF24]